MQKTSQRKGHSTSVQLTNAGRAALEKYTRSLRALLDPVEISPTEGLNHVN